MCTLERAISVSDRMVLSLFDMCCLFAVAVCQSWSTSQQFAGAYGRLGVQFGQERWPQLDIIRWHSRLNDVAG